MIFEPEIRGIATLPATGRGERRNDEVAAQVVRPLVIDAVYAGFVA